MNNKFISIDDVLVRTEIVETPFLCDLEKCKGACCTFESELGAPIKRDEIGKIDSILELVKGYLTQKHISEIEDNGFYEEIDGELLIRSIDNKACVFVYYENNIAKCSIEKAFNDGKTNFRKPISCHLFPIRVADFGGDILRFEKIDECIHAIENGNKNNIITAEFCKEPLSRLYGKKWYSKLKKAIGR